MLYFVPVGAYTIYFFLSTHEKKSSEHILLSITGVLIITLAAMGREILGSHLVDILDYYHFMGISNLLFVAILWYCHPKKFSTTSAAPTPAKV